jgi:D-3-phosphoglycerate dehydrogenase
MRIKLECPYDFMDQNIVKNLDLSDNPECLIVNPGVDKFLDEKYFSQFPNLKVVGTPSTGVNHMDTDYLDKNGIKYFCLLDDRKGLESITASAEFTWLHIMNAFRKFNKAIDPLHTYSWRELDNEEYLRSNELHNKKLVIIGYGRIGRKIYNYAKAFGMEVKVYDPYIREELSDSFLLNHYCSSLSDLKKINPDIISVNCYLTPETTNMVDKNLLEGLKDGLIVVNTSRGEVVNECDIAELIENKNIFYSCDVLCNEQNIDKLRKNSPIFKMNSTHDNLVITPHVAGCTIESQEKALKSMLKLCMKSL